MDDARIQRLTELARKVWPELEHPSIEGPLESIASGATLHDDGLEYLHVHPHPHALDALEAALCVLAGEEPMPVSWVQYRDAVDRTMRLEERLGALEQLASDWERYAKFERGDGPGRPGPAYVAYEQCAAELRKRAKEAGHD
jgi:hypothetical protein